MCGIVGYRGNREASSIILECLKNLEYRGYDSVGIATKQNSVFLKKGVGKIDDVHNDIDFTSLPGKIGIGHTRWATNGEVNKENCHPHCSNDNSIYVVHNGIIENHQELRKQLAAKGVEFSSSTDSEVIAQLISYNFYEDKEHQNSRRLLNAVRATLLKLKGSFALVVMNSHDNSLIFARNDSPLVIGINNATNNTNKASDISTDKAVTHNTTIEEQEYFLASDVPAFLNYTNKVLYLDNYQYGIIGENGVRVFDINSNEEITHNPIEIDWSIDEAKKGKYKHFMIKEICEQHDTIKKAAEQDSALMKKTVHLIRNAFGLFFVGCGTSYHAAVSSSYIFTHVAKKHVNVVLGSEFRNYTEFLTDKTVMVAMSQSGETADLLDAVRQAKEKGVKVISICNVMGSTLTRMSDLNIMMNSGPEISVLSTKSYTSQLAILLLLAYSAVGRENEAKSLINDASEVIRRTVSNDLKKIESIAEKIKDQRDIFLIGRDLAYPSALEGALKIKEVSYIHAEGFAGGELKHGTIALIEKGTPCITLTTKATKDMILSNSSEIKARGGYIIGINSDKNELYDEFIKVKELGNANPIVMVVPIQILAYYLALKRGCDPDKPRNLAKSVTVR